MTKITATLTANYNDGAETAYELVLEQGSQRIKFACATQNEGQILLESLEVLVRRITHDSIVTQDWSSAT